MDRRSWRRAVFAHRASTLAGWLGWLVASVAALLAGDVLPTPGLLASRNPPVSSSDPNIVVGSSSLVLSKTTGWPDQRQQDARSSFPARWRGAGTWVSGELRVDDRGLLWSPSPPWRGVGAKEFLLAWSEVTGVEILDGRPEACVIRVQTGGEVWFALHATGLGPVITGRRAAA